MQQQGDCSLSAIGIAGGRAPHLEAVVDLQMTLPLPVLHDRHRRHDAFQMVKHAFSRRECHQLQKERQRYSLSSSRKGQLFPF
jgi:hypothetical protein